MTHAYSELYLSNAQGVLGSMLDHAVYDMKWKLDDFYGAFINSGIAYRFGIGEPKFTVGMSGAEVAREVVRCVTGRTTEIEPSSPFERSPEYWAGWSVAYYEWIRNIPFERINKTVPITEIVSMYSPYHEADITRTVVELDRRMESRREGSTLARLRAYADMTQRMLAESSGVSIRMIEQYEQGKKNIDHASASTVYRLARALNCSMEELIM